MTANDWYDQKEKITGLKIELYNSILGFPSNIVYFSIILDTGT